MKKNILYFLLLISPFLAFSQEKLKGSKVVITQEREISPFNKILVKNDIDVFISQGNDYSVSVETDDNLQEVIITRIYDGTLEIYYSREIKSSKKLAVYIQVYDPELIIESRDDAKIFTTSEISLDKLELIAMDKSKQNVQARVQTVNISISDKANIEGSLLSSENINIFAEDNSNVKMVLDTETLDVKSFKSTLLKFSGSAKNVLIETTDNGNFEGKNLLIDDAIIKATDKSDIIVNVAKNIEISAENNAEVYIYDNPKYDVVKFTDKASIHKK